MSRENNKYSLACAKFDEVWLRISQETDIKYLKDLAVLVGVSQQFISMRRKENLFPFGWAYPVARKYGLLGDWILSGEGPKRLDDIKNKTEIDFPVLEDLNDWLKEVTFYDPGRKDWFRVQVEDFFPKFKDWLKRKEKKDSESKNFPDSKVA